MQLALSTYNPKLTDPRIHRRIVRVLDFSSIFLSSTAPEPMHNKKLREIFGAPGNPLTDFLRANLLIQHGNYIKGKQSMSYLLNENGYQKLIIISKHMVSTSPETVIEKYPELKSLNFPYKEQSNRYWHPLQNIKREKKAEFWRGHLPFNYDIEACAPTLLMQCAKSLGTPDLVLAGIQDYLDDRDGLREHVTALTGLKLHDSKTLVNSLFNGAKLAANGYCAAYRLMNHDPSAMARLQADRRIRSLRRSVKFVWDRLEFEERMKQIPTLEQVFNGTAKPSEKKLKSSKQKWSFYFSKERQVLDAITNFLDVAGIKYFKEHDGFRTDREIDIAKVELAVLTETGFKIKLSNGSE